MKLDKSGLRKFEKMLRGDIPVASIGILGDTTKRKEGELSNADIGLMHEVGTSKMRQRSWLRMPLKEKLKAYLEKSGALSPRSETMREVFRSGSFMILIKKMALSGETVIQDAFHTGGFGQWSPSDMRRKKNHQTLVETQQLRDSVTSEVRQK